MVFYVSQPDQNLEFTLHELEALQSCLLGCVEASQVWYHQKNKIVSHEIKQEDNDVIILPKCDAARVWLGMVEICNLDWIASFASRRFIFRPRISRIRLFFLHQENKIKGLTCSNIYLWFFGEG